MALRENAEKIQQIERITEEGKQSRTARRENERKVRGGRRPRVRLFPIWLRLVIVTVLAAAFFLFGAMFGYSVIGDGKATDVFKTSTWTHIRDLVEKEE